MSCKTPKELRILSKRITEAEEKWDATLKIAWSKVENSGKQDRSIERKEIS